MRTCQQREQGRQDEQQIDDDPDGSANAVEKLHGLLPVPRSFTLHCRCRGCPRRKAPRLCVPCWHFAGIARRFTTARGVLVLSALPPPVRKYSLAQRPDVSLLTELSNVV